MPGGSINPAAPHYGAGYLRATVTEGDTGQGKRRFPWTSRVEETVFFTAAAKVAMQRKFELRDATVDAFESVWREAVRLDADPAYVPHATNRETRAERPALFRDLEGNHIDQGQRLAGSHSSKDESPFFPLDIEGRQMPVDGNWRFAGKGDFGVVNAAANERFRAAMNRDGAGRVELGE